LKRKRIEFDGAMYHVTQRGNNHEPIFSTGAHKNTYLRLLKTYKRKFDFRLLGYTLMNNHYHLLVQTGAEPLSRIMHSINTTYSRYYNRENERSGHVFSSRYAASLVLDDSYLFAVLRYLHWNPVRANISSSAAGYKWSSDNAYRRNDNSFVDIDFILDIFNKDRGKAVRTYRRLIQTAGQEEFDNSPLIGDEPSIKEVKIKLKTNQKSDTGEIIEEIPARKPLAAILSDTGAGDTQIKLIKSGSRKRPLKPFKAAFIRAALAEGYTCREIGSYMNISHAAVSKNIK